MKKILTLVMAVLLAFSLTACASPAEKFASACEDFMDSIAKADIGGAEKALENAKGALEALEEDEKSEAIEEIRKRSENFTPETEIDPTELSAEDSARIVELSAEFAALLIGASSIDIFGSAGA